MCHASVLRWFPEALTAADVAGREVLEVGSYDVNGSVRPAVELLGPASYLGVDRTRGPRVDRVLDVAGLVEAFGVDSFGVVIATEVLEHVVDWAGCLAQLCEVLRPGGVLMLTTRSPGFPYHPFPIDTWRYPPAGMRDLLGRAGLEIRLLVGDPQFPGVFVKATKPAGWRAPWADRPLAEVFAGVDVEPAPPR